MPRSVVVADVERAGVEDGAEVGGGRLARAQRLHGRALHVGGERVEHVLRLVGGDRDRRAGAVGRHVAEREVDARLRRRGLRGRGRGLVVAAPGATRERESGAEGHDEHRDRREQRPTARASTPRAGTGRGVGCHRRLRVGDPPSPTRALERPRGGLVSFVAMALKKMVERFTKPVEEIDREQLTAFCDARQLAAMDDIAPRSRVKVGGEVRSVRIVPRAGAPALEVTVSDGRGSIVGVFLGPPQDRGPLARPQGRVRGRRRPRRQALPAVQPDLRAPQLDPPRSEERS